MEARNMNKQRNPRESLTRDQLMSIIHYDPETGWFTSRTTGEAAGYVFESRYIRISIGDYEHQAHRLAWLYMTGSWPREAIDHIDGDGLNNRFANLREATIAQNVFNSIPGRKKKTGLPRGVSRTPEANTFRAEISKNKKKIHLGCYPTPEEASEVYQLAAEMLHGEFAFHLNHRAARAEQEGKQCA